LGLSRPATAHSPTVAADWTKRPEFVVGETARPLADPQKARGGIKIMQ
jgi:hypothetical protein